MHKCELSLSQSYKLMPFCRYRIQKVLSRTIFKSERSQHTVATDLHFLFQTIWLALRKSKQPTFHVYLPTDSIKSMTQTPKLTDMSNTYTLQNEVDLDDTTSKAAG